MMKRPAALALVLATALTGCRSTTDGPRDLPAAAPEAAAPGSDPAGIAWNWPAPPPASIGMPAADDREVAFTSVSYTHLMLPTICSV